MAVGIGFSLEKRYDIPTEEMIALLSHQGASAVSPQWSPELDLLALAKTVKERGMKIQSLHAPHTDTPFLWEPESDKGRLLFQNILRSVEDCARCDVPLLVIHGWQGLFYTFPEAPLNFHFFDKIVAQAEKNGIRIAFENLEGEEYLKALLSRYTRYENVGFCWDSGHDFCYQHKTDFLEKFGGRLMMTHIHDNFGLQSPDGVPSCDDDLHLIPFDGNYDWTDAISRLKKAAHQDILNLEIKKIPRSKKRADRLYENLTAKEFIARGVIGAQKVVALYENE